MADSIPVMEAQSDSELLLDTTVNDRKIQHLLERADRMSRELSNGRGYVWAAIGIDSTPCKMGCSFCSHAEKWDVYSGNTLMAEDEILLRAGDAADRGADFVVLRTTQCYETERLADLGRKVRSRIGDDIHLVVNTGECDESRVKTLMRAGFNMAYHVVRLREGIDTGHSVQMRADTIRAIRAAGMDIQYLVEPLGPEHTAQEILLEARRARAVGASGTGVMARVPVMGTPLAHLGQVSEGYLRRVAAATRLEYPDGGKHLCVHPHAFSYLRCGSNTVIVEQAANPRDTSSSTGPWRGFDMAAARAALVAAGLTVRPARKS